MSGEQWYRVVWPTVQVKFATPQDGGGLMIQGGTFYRGQILPEIDPKQRDHLLSLKMIEPVQPTAAAEPAEAA